MKFSKLNAPSLKELFIEELETMILSGQLEVGEKLPSERELAESMQVSRSVVNAGVTELARKGFLQIKPRVGTFVVDYRRDGTVETLLSIMHYNGGQLREAETRSMLEIKLVLDSLAAELAIAKITPEQLQSLKGYLQAIKESNHAEEAATCSFKFYHELAFISGNTLIPLIYNSFHIPVLRLWTRYSKKHGTSTMYGNAHALYSAIEERDVETAKQVIDTSVGRTITGPKEIYYE